MDTIDGLTLTVPVILKYAHADERTRNQKILECIRVTRRTRALDKYATAYSDMLIKVLSLNNFILFTYKLCYAYYL